MGDYKQQAPKAHILCTKKQDTQMHHKELFGATVTFLCTGNDGFLDEKKFLLVCRLCTSAVSSVAVLHDTHPWQQSSKFNHEDVSHLARAKTRQHIWPDLA